MLLKVCQHSQEKTCARVSFLLKLQAWPITSLKKRPWRRAFPVNFPKFLKTQVFYFLWQMPVLRKTYAVLWVANRYVGSETPKHNVYDLIDGNFDNLNFISNIFQETHNLLVFTDSVFNCRYLRRSQRKFLWK